MEALDQPDNFPQVFKKYQGLLSFPEKGLYACICSFVEETYLKSFLKDIVRILLSCGAESVFPVIYVKNSALFVLSSPTLAKQEKIRQSLEELHYPQQCVTFETSFLHGDTSEDLFAQIKEGEIKELNIVLKADVQGSIEAIRQSLEKLGNEEVRVNIIRTAVGGIREADVMLAAASNALIIGFNVRPDSGAKRLAEKEEIQINTYRVIYEAIEDVKSALSGMLDPDIKEVELGQAEIRSIFKVPKVGAVAGCYVTDGKLNRNARVRVVRDGVVIHDGNLASLKRFKDDVKEVKAGYECGLVFEGFNDIQELDQVEAYIMVEVPR